MNVLETSFVLDYWDGEGFARDFFASLDDDVGVATVSLFELYLGALLAESPNATVGSIADDLSWAEPLPFTDGAAREATRIESELTDRGEKINLADVLIAGVARDRGATLVTTDGHFDRVDGLDVHNPRA